MNLKFTKNKLIYLLAIVILLLYNFTPSLNGFDCPYYLLAGEHFFNGIIDCLRTPSYPILIYALYSAFGYKWMTIMVTLIQSIVYLQSIYAFQKIEERLLSNKVLQIIIILPYILCIAPGWCNELSTESFSISGCLMLTNLILSYSSSKHILTIIRIHLLLLSLVFLRPTFILFFAIMPVLWIYLLIRENAYRPYHLSCLLLTIICIGCFALYCQQYKQVYGKFASTITFECNSIYDLHRAQIWNVSDVSSPRAQLVIKEIDSLYTCNYGVIYDMIQQHPDKLILIDEGCNEMKQKHLAEFYRYRLVLTINSFDKRMSTAVNTHTPLSCILFFVSLFLSMPMSFFYLIVVVSFIVSIIILMKSHFISFEFPLLSAIIFAQCIGVLLTTSDSHERVMTPVYGLTLIALGIIIELIIKRYKRNQQSYTSL